MQKAQKVDKVLILVITLLPKKSYTNTNNVLLKKGNKMVATENKTLHDKLQSLCDREKIAQSPKNYLPIVCEFGKELARNKLLDGIKQTIAETGKPYFAASPELKIKNFNERNAAKNLLLGYKDIIPALSIYLQEYEDIEKTSQPMSWDQAYGLDYVLLKACFLIRNDRSADHSVILKQLITFGENGQIIGYIFSHSLNEWQYYLALIEQNKKTALWYSVHYLIRLHELNDIEGRLKKRYALLQDNQHFALYCFDLDTQNFDKALEQYDVQKARSLDFDIEECKMHLHQVWEFIKPLLLVNNSSPTEVSNNKQSLKKRVRSNRVEILVSMTTVTLKSSSGLKDFSTNDSTGSYLRHLSLSVVKNSKQTSLEKKIWAKMENEPESSFGRIGEAPMIETRKSLNKGAKKIDLEAFIKRTPYKRGDEKNLNKEIWFNHKYDVVITVSNK